MTFIFSHVFLSQKYFLYYVMIWMRFEIIKPVDRHLISFTEPSPAQSTIQCRWVAHDVVELVGICLNEGKFLSKSKSVSVSGPDSGNSVHSNETKQCK